MDVYGIWFDNGYSSLFKTICNTQEIAIFKSTIYIVKVEFLFFNIKIIFYVVKHYLLHKFTSFKSYKFVVNIMKQTFRTVHKLRNVIKG